MDEGTASLARCLATAADTDSPQLKSALAHLAGLPLGKASQALDDAIAFALQSGASPVSIVTVLGHNVSTQHPLYSLLVYFAVWNVDEHKFSELPVNLKNSLALNVGPMYFGHDVTAAADGISRFRSYLDENSFQSAVTATQSACGRLNPEECIKAGSDKLADPFFRKGVCASLTALSPESARAQLDVLMDRCPPAHLGNLASDIAASGKGNPLLTQKTLLCRVQPQVREALLSHASTEQPGEVIRFLDENDPAADYGKALKDFISRDIYSASLLASRLPPSSKRDQIVVQLVSVLGESDPEAATVWLSTVGGRK